MRKYPTDNAPIIVGMSQILTSRPTVLPEPRVELWLHRKDESTGSGEGPVVVTRRQLFGFE